MTQLIIGFFLLIGTVFSINYSLKKQHEELLTKTKSTAVEAIAASIEAQRVARDAEAETVKAQFAAREAQILLVKSIGQTNECMDLLKNKRGY